MQQFTSKRSSTFGIISIVVGVIAYMTPKIFLSMVLIALAAFVIIGLIRDGSKVFSIIGLFLGLGILYLLTQEAVNDDRMYSVRYAVQCDECEVRYTNTTGGSDEDDNASIMWEKQILAKGDLFLSLSAQNKGRNGPVSAKIFVDGVLIQEETSSGDYAIASVNCNPSEVNSK